MGGGATRQAVRPRAEPAPARPIDVTEAKLMRPRLRPGLVPRTELIERLRSARTATIASVIAPAGYGKTLLLAEWAERDRRPFAWVSVDHTDADPSVLLAHVAVALDRIEPLPEEVFRAIASPGAHNPGRAVRRLGAALAVRRRRFVLVLDDLDRVADPLGYDAIATLAEHLRSGSVIAFAGRSAPDLRLPRLRTEGRLVEIGADDLALGAHDVRQLLRGAGVATTKGQAERVTEATEGWPVGVYLAGLSLREQRRSGVPPIGFSGRDRFVVDYVRAEVLGRLSPNRQRFLTRTSILEQLAAPLCDAVLQRTGSGRTLRALEESSLLLVPLDRERGWYRYHHLFRDVLRAELELHEPELVPTLHRRAADWFDRLGLLEQAMDHAFAGGDTDRTVRLLQRAGQRAWLTGRIGTLHTWIDRLGEVVNRNAGLAVAAAWISALSGDAGRADHWADVFEALPSSGPSELGTTSLRSAIALVRATMTRDGHEEMLREAELAVREEPDASSFRPAALLLRGLGNLMTDDARAADRSFADAAELAGRMGLFPTVSASLAERSLIATAAGDRGAATGFAEQAARTVREANLHEHLTTGPVHAACARVALRAGDLERARAELAAAQLLRPVLTYAFPSVSVQTRLELAKVHVGLADIAGARTLLGEVDEILNHRPDLGSLALQAVELRSHVDTIRSVRSPGPSTITAAELRVLAFLPTHLSFQEIGARLFVSRTTAKTQAISIYRKLGVSKRSEAVRAAREIGLLEP